MLKTDHHKFMSRANQFLAIKKQLLFIVLFFLSLSVSAQYIHHIKADSVRLHNDSTCNAELIIENGTRHIKGFLYNKGNGRTEFRAIMLKVGDSVYALGSGGDTIKFNTNVILNQFTEKQVANYSIDTAKSLRILLTDTSGNKILDFNGSAGSIITWTDKYPYKGLQSTTGNYNSIGTALSFSSLADTGSRYRRSPIAIFEKGISNGAVGQTVWGDNIFYPSAPALWSKGYYALKLPASKTITFNGTKDAMNAGMVSGYYIGMKSIGNDTATIQTGVGTGAAINHFLRYDCWPGSAENVFHKGQYINSLSYLDFASKNGSYIESFVDYYAGTQNNYSSGQRIRQKINFYAANDQFGYTDRNYGFYQEGTGKLNFFAGKVMIKDSSLINADIYDFYNGGSSKFAGNIVGSGRTLLGNVTDDGSSSLQVKGQGSMDSLLVGSTLYRSRNMKDVLNGNDFTTRFDGDNGFGMNFNGGWYNGQSSIQFLNLAGYHTIYSLGSSNGLHLNTYPSKPISLGGSKVIFSGYGSGTKTGTATYNLAVDLSGNIIEVASGGGAGMSNPMTTLGDIIYGGSAGAATRLAGNTTAAKKLLTQTGDGTNSAAPGWNILVATDIPSLDASKITTGVIDQQRIQQAPGSLTDGATITWDVTTGINKYVTLGGNRTLAFSNLANLVGSYLYLKVVQDGTGSRTLTLPSSCKVVNGGGGAVTLTTTAGAFDVISIYVFSSTELHVSYGRNFN